MGLKRHVQRMLTKTDALDSFTRVTNFRPKIFLQARNKRQDLIEKL